MARKTPPPEQPDEPKPLNPQQMLFVDAYMLHFNATKAAIEAGYSPKTAYSQGSRLLNHVEIKAELERRYKANAMSAAEILQHLTEIARGDIDDVVDANGNLDMEKARKAGRTRLLKKLKSRTIVSETSDIVETETELYGRLEALKLLGQFHALFTDKVDVTSDGKPVAVTLVWADGTPLKKADSE